MAQKASMIMAKGGPASSGGIHALFDSEDPSVFAVTTKAAGPAGALPLTDEMLRHWPSGDLFGLSQNAGMGWTPAEVDRDPFLILSTQGGLRAPDGSRSRWGITPATGRSACWCRRRPRS